MIVGKIVSFASVLAGLLPALGIGFSSLAGPILAVVAALTALAAVIYAIYKITGSSKPDLPELDSEGSYASGLSYVPKDMTVRVHEGERILTKQENKSNFGNTNSSPRDIHFDLSIPLDGREIAHAQYHYNEQEGILRGDDLVTGKALK